jgi:hypothetical protein
MSNNTLSSFTLSEYFGFNLLGDNFAQDSNMHHVKSVIKFLFTEHISAYRNSEIYHFEELVKINSNSIAVEFSVKLLKSLWLVKCEGRSRHDLMLTLRHIEKSNLLQNYSNHKNSSDLQFLLFCVFLVDTFLYYFKDGLVTKVLRHKFLGIYKKSKCSEAGILHCFNTLYTLDNFPKDLKVYCGVLCYPFFPKVVPHDFVEGYNIQKKFTAKESHAKEICDYLSDVNNYVRDTVLAGTILGQAREYKIVK